MNTITVGAEVARNLARAASEPEWLERWRTAAWEDYASTPLPDRVTHVWRYTEPEKFLTDKVEHLVPKDGSRGKRIDAGAADALAERLGIDDLGDLAGLLVNQDANGALFTLAPEWHDAGVIFCDLGTAVREHADLVEPWLGKAVPFDAGKFTGLNAALFSGGVFLYVPKDVELIAPVHAVYGAGTDLSAVFPRTLVLLEQGATATLIDEFGAGTDAAAGGKAPRVIVHGVIEGHVGRNAQLHYINLQNWGARTRSHSTQRIRADRDGSVVTVNVALGGLYNKTELGTELYGPNATSEMIGVLFGDARQHFDHRTEHLHAHGNTYSDIDFKVVLEDRARSAYTGLIRIDLEAANSEAFQENRNLLLDPECRAESIPELEILNEDVRCTHGATVGPIDEEQVFYLMTRGLSRRAAERAVVEGFFTPVLDRIEDLPLRERLWGYIGDKLGAR